MTKYKNIKLIAFDFDAEIEKYDKLLSSQNIMSTAYIVYDVKLILLKELRENLIDATPILKETWDAANEWNRPAGFDSGVNFEQFLETEVKQ